MANDALDDSALAFDAEVATAEFLGEFVRYERRAAGQRVVADLPHARHQPPLAAGHRARFAVPVNEILVLPPG